MKGFRTIFTGLGLAVGAPALQYLGLVDWSTILSPAGALVVSGVIQIAMRMVTTGPVGSSR